MTDTALKTNHQHPPLAIDAYGNPIDIPDGAASWRICRKTTGRPREIVDENKHPVRFPLDTTCEQLVERCGRDVYRVYALDEVGELLDHVSTVDLTSTSADLRNSSLSEPATSLVRSPGTAASTDLRFALEAMTQMMRTNADALRIVTESHVDLAKTIAVAKGLPRNASAFMGPPVAREDDEDDDDDVDGVERPKTWIDVAAPIVEQLAPTLPLILGGRLLPSVTGNATENDQSPAADPDTCEMTAEEIELAKRPNWEPKDLMDLAYAKRKADAKRKLKAIAGNRSSTPAALQIPHAIRARLTTDATLMPKLLAVKAQLSEAELRALFDLVGRMTEADQTRLIEHLSSAPVEECVLVARELIAGANATQQR